MKKYEVNISEVEIYRLEIESESESDAIREAYSLIENSVFLKGKYHVDSDSSAEAFEME